MRVDFAKASAAADAAVARFTQGASDGKPLAPAKKQAARVPAATGPSAPAAPALKHAGRLVLHNLPFTVRSCSRKRART